MAHKTVGQESCRYAPVDCFVAKRPSRVLFSGSRLHSGRPADLGRANFPAGAPQACHRREAWQTSGYPFSFFVGFKVHIIE